MAKNKLLMGFTLFLILFVLIGSVSATDDNTTTLSQGTDNEISQEKISTVNNDSILEWMENNEILKISPENTTLKTSVSGDTFTDIQNAISSASSGDTIELEGLYKGLGTAIIIDKNNLTIVGNDAILDAQGQSRILNITGTGVTLKNIKFINGNATDNGGAIYWQGTDGTVTTCKFSNNTAKSDGGAIYWQGTDGNISNCEINSNFINNRATRGGAIFFNNETDNVTIAGYFEGNVAQRTGGALCFQAKSFNNIISADFYNNSAIYASGGAIFFYNLAENNQFESIFMNNYALYGGGIFFYKKANNNRFDSNFTFNIAKSCGGAIFFYNTTNNNNFTGYFTNNSALGKVDETVGNGGAITFKDVSTNCIFTCDFINNTAALNGGV